MLITKGRFFTHSSEGEDMVKKKKKVYNYLADSTIKKKNLKALCTFI